MKHSTVKDFNRLLMSIFFVASVTACNKEEFYQKDYLQNPFADNTVVTGGSNGGDSSGVDGSTQGGVDSGVTSGTTNGTTGGSSTGSTTGGSTTGGSTTGGSTTGGSTTGGSTTGGSTTGGSTTGGSTTGGSTTGGSTTGGSTTGGSTTGGSTTGGSTTGGSTTGGSTTGGSTTGGSTTGGSTTGGSTTGGSTTGGSTTGGSTTGGSTTGGSTTGGANYQDVSESFSQSVAQTKKLDIMWVIDDSGSMADEQAALGSNFNSFITQFINRDVDFKMGITTTDTSSSSRKGKLVTGSDTKLTSAAAAANPNQFMLDFKNLVKVGTSGSGYEKGLMATEGFMEKYAQSFIRPDAYLAVVILSDEEDQSPKSVAAYTDYLKSFKANAGLVKIYSIVNANDVNTGGNTIGHARYELASNQTAGVMSDIMDNFDDVLLEMGDSIVNLLDSFALAAAPVNGTLKVYVNGVESLNYTFDAASRSIKFTQGNLPPVGAQVTVNYKKVI